MRPQRTKLTPEEEGLRARLPYNRPLNGRSPTRPDPADDPFVEVGLSFRWRMVGAAFEAGAIIVVVIGAVVLIARAG